MGSPADPGHLKPLASPTGSPSPDQKTEPLTLAGASGEPGLRCQGSTWDPCFLKGCLGLWKERTPWIP